MPANTTSTTPPHPVTFAAALLTLTRTPRVHRPGLLARLLRRHR